MGRPLRKPKRYFTPLIALFAAVLLVSAFTINSKVASTTDKVTATYAPQVDLPDVTPINYGAAEAAVGVVEQARQTFIQGLAEAQYIRGISEAEAARQAAVAAVAVKPKTVVRNSAPAPVNVGSSGGGSVWDRLAQCEAGGNWATHTANGFSGGLQFVNSTWTANGGGAFAPYAWQASREQQIVVAERVLAASGWGAWPGCSRKLGLR